MAQPSFDYKGAFEAGYSESEINDFLSQRPSVNKPTQATNPISNAVDNVKSAENPQQDDLQNKFNLINHKLLKKVPNFDVESALQTGYEPDEINDFLQQQIPEKSFLEQAGRIGGQYALGAAEMASLPYEIGVMGVGSTEAQVARTRESIADDVENLLAKKYAGDWSEKDENELHELRELWKNPDKIAKEIAHKPIDISIRGLVEKATGISTDPEGILEKAAHWTGFIKDPKNIVKLAEGGAKVKDIIKAITPTGTEIAKGLSAGTALQMAENNHFGPIGTMAAAVVGDVVGGGIAGAVKGTTKAAMHPKKFFAEVAAKFSPKEKVKLQQDLIKDFRDAGIQADLGTITDSELIKMTQSRLIQSGFTGDALDNFRSSLTKQIKEEYKAVADSLGEARFASNHEAGLIAKEGMKSIRETDLAATRQLYENANKALKETSFVDSRKLASAIGKLERELAPGSIKSVEQQAVLNSLEKIKKDLYTDKGKLKLANVKDLMNNKIALNDIINYEVQGGAKQLLKGIVGELDRAIISHGKENIPFVKNYITANKRFSKHAQTFRNKSAKRIFNAEDPSQLINNMNSVQGIQDIKKILSKTPEGEAIFNNLQRYKLDKIIGDNLVDSTTQQVKLGTFSNLLDKGKNREIVKEILGVQSFKRLERLQKNAGKLAEAANKFFNASKSGAAAADVAIYVKGMSDIASILMGNPWPLAKTLGGILGAKKLSNLLADPEFLKLTEDVILASEKGTIEQLVFAVEKLSPYFQAVNQGMRQQN